MQAIINSKLILPHTVLTGQTLLFGTHIYDILPAGSPLPEGTESIDAKGAYLSPGFINMHIHGCGGADTMDGTRTSMEILCRKLPKCGVTAFLPTTMTRVWPIVQKALRNVRKAMEVPCPGKPCPGGLFGRALHFRQLPGIAKSRGNPSGQYGADPPLLRRHQSPCHRPGNTVFHGVYPFMLQKGHHRFPWSFRCNL